MTKELLDSISRSAIDIGDYDFSTAVTDQQWLGNKAISHEEISLRQKQLNTEFPADYVTFLRITNGFASPCSTEPSFMHLDEVDYLRNIDAELIEIWKETGNVETAELLHRSICIGGKDEEQLFLLIPPSSQSEIWLYWKFATWIPGEEAYDSLQHYFQHVDSFMTDIISESNE